MQLESATNYKIILVAAPLNEITHRIKTGGKKGRDETIKTVVEEQNKMINVSANTDGKLGTLHLVMPPFLRQDPPWMEERLKWVTFNIKDKISVNSPWNVGIGNLIEIVPADLGADKVHLNESGMEKLFKGLENDLKKCKENLGEGDVCSQDWASQVVDEPMDEPPTPGTMKRTRENKRARETPETESEEEEEEVTAKKVKKDSAGDKMDKMLAMMKEMKEDLKEKVVNTVKKVEELNVEVKDIKEELGKDKELTAETLENIDGLENENLRASVIVRKLKADKKVPKDKKELRTYVQDLARVLVGKVLNSNASKGVKYASTLYAFVDPTKKDNKEGLVPPFKICFNTKDLAVEFREKAVKMAKAGVPRRVFGAAQDEEWDEEAAPRNEQGPAGATNICQGAYFSFYQTAATRFRVTLMWAVADALKTKTKQVWVSQNNKPTLQVKEGGKVVKSLTFVQTMNEYKEKIGQKTLDEVKKSASKLYAGRLEKTFIVIKD